MSEEHPKYYYYNDDPEVVAGQVHGNAQAGVSPGVGYSQPLAIEKQAPRTIFGLRRTSFWLVIVIVVLILAGAIGGGVGGSLANKSASTQNVGASPSSSAPSTGPQTGTSTSSFVAISATSLPALATVCPSSSKTVNITNLAHHTYTVTCGQDCPLNDIFVTGPTDIGWLPVANIIDCADMCSTRSDCVAAIMVDVQQSYQQCFLKSVLQNCKDSPNHQVAARVIGG